MTRPVRVAVQIQPGGTPDYRTWREAVLAADDLGVDVIFGYDHFHRPAMEAIVDGKPVLYRRAARRRQLRGLDRARVVGRDHLTRRDRAPRHRRRLPQRGPARRHGAHRRPHQRRPAHPRPRRGWYEKDYTTYGYDYGTFGSRFDLFDESLIRIENRLAALIPPPVRKLPILIGGTGPKRSLPAVARHADIWHAFQDLDAFRRSSDRVDELAATFGRNGADIERSTLWENATAPMPSARQASRCSRPNSPPTTVTTSRLSRRCSHGGTTGVRLRDHVTCSVRRMRISFTAACAGWLTM